jgi:hypothetical protein
MSGDSTARQPLRIGCTGWLVIGGICFLLGFVVFRLWMTSTADLNRIEQRLATMRPAPATGTEAATQTMYLHDQPGWREWLNFPTKTWTESEGSKIYPKGPGYMPIDSARQYLIERSWKLSSLSLNGVDPQIRTRPSQPYRQFDCYPTSWRQAMIGAIEEEVCFPQPSHSWIDRCMEVIERLPQDNLMDLYTGSQLQYAVMRTLVAARHRLTDVQAQRLQTVAWDRWQHIGQALIGEVQARMAVFCTPGFRPHYRHEWYQVEFLHIITRHTRARTLNAMLDLAPIWKTLAIHEQCLRTPSQVSRLCQDKLGFVADSYWGFLSPNWMIGKTLQDAVHADIIGSHLAHLPMPVDRLDPRENPYKPITRNGIIIGHYSVGVDGVDDGGSIGSDICVAHTEWLGQPKASNPLPTTP